MCISRLSLSVDYCLSINALCPANAEKSVDIMHVLLLLQVLLQLG